MGIFFNKKKAKEAAEKATVYSLSLDYENALLEWNKLNMDEAAICAKRTQKYYCDEARKIQFKENEDYEIDKGGKADLIIFYDKTIQPLQFEKNDDLRKYLYRKVQKGKVLGKIRQQRTQGSLSGRSRVHFEHHGGGFFGGGSASADGGGHIDGSLDTLDEFILIIQFEKLNMEVRVSANLFYQVEEKDELFMTYPDYYYNSEDLEEIGYSMEEITQAEISLREKKQLWDKKDTLRDTIQQLIKALPKEIENRTRNKIDYLCHRSRWQ